MIHSTPNPIQMSSANPNEFSQTENGKQVIIRQLAEFHPNLWGDRFVNYVADDKVLMDTKERINELKEKVKKELTSTVHNPSKQLKLIGDVQQLGVGYHFEKEIGEALTLIHEAHRDYEVNNHDDLYDISLRFRLLRQQGFDISCDIFNKFKGNQGNFIETLVEDKQGMLGLYEAAQMRKHGEEILDEALVFTTTHLRDGIETSSDLQGNVHLASQVKHALVYPIRKNIPRLEARYYISVYDQVEWCSKVVSELAKLDFNLVQSLHQQELRDITRWWKKLDFPTKLPFGRDRVVELYSWMMGMYSDPKFSAARIISTKTLALMSYIDDTYDVRGTLAELELFTNAIDRWNIDCLDQLPVYMKILYQAILDLYDEIEKDVIKQGRPFSAHYAREVLKMQVNAYLVEAKVFFKQYVPAYKEYINNAMVSSGYIFVAVTALVGLEEVGTKEALDWLFNIPKVLRASSMIARLLNDLVSHKFEQKRGHVASAVECYMIEHGVTEEEASDKLRKEVANEWKDINEEMLNVSDENMRLILKIILDLTKATEVIYTKGDGYTIVSKDVQTHITLLLIDPVPI